jgi:hypothetical protein
MTFLCGFVIKKAKIQLNWELVGSIQTDFDLNL